jgi:hydroxymethylpyrimidine/phosphomethylpyrimidine kinase
MSVAGLDPTGGAGIAADIKTGVAHGCLIAPVLTSILAQCQDGVLGRMDVDASLVEAQIEAVLRDTPVAGIKIGLVPNPAVGQLLTDWLSRRAVEVPVVLDPVLAASSGAALIQPGTEAALAQLVGRVDLVCPNRTEASRLVDAEVEVAELARRILALGPRAVLITGGDSDVDDPEVTDVFLVNGQLKVMAGPRVHSLNNRGTGCTLSTAIACGLARGLDLVEAVGAARQFVAQAIAGAAGWEFGGRPGPIDHLGFGLGTGHLGVSGPVTAAFQLGPSRSQVQ